MLVPTFSRKWVLTLNPKHRWGSLRQFRGCCFLHTLVTGQKMRGFAVVSGQVLRSWLLIQAVRGQMWQTFSATPGVTPLSQTERERKIQSTCSIISKWTHLFHSWSFTRLNNSETVRKTLFWVKGNILTDTRGRAVALLRSWNALVYVTLPTAVVITGRLVPPGCHGRGVWGNADSFPQLPPSCCASRQKSVPQNHTMCSALPKM